MGLSARLVQIQIFRHEAYSAEARAQYLERRTLKASRGRVVDRRGNNLAVDVQATSFYANPEQVEEPKRVAAHFAPLSDKRAESIERQLRGDKQFIYLARQVVDANVGEVAYAGVFQHPETRRQYPLGPLAGQLIGHTNIDNIGARGLSGPSTTFCAKRTARYWNMSMRGASKCPGVSSDAKSLSTAAT